METTWLNAQDADFDAKLAALTAWSEERDEEVADRVRGILRDVAKRGDAALVEYTNRFDRRDVASMAELVVGHDQLQAALARIPAEQREALEAAAERVRRYHEKQKQDSWQYREADGTLLGQQVTPLDRAGIYVPGGKAAYPSSVLMNAFGPPALFTLIGLGHAVLVVFGLVRMRARPAAAQAPGLSLTSRHPHDPEAPPPVPAEKSDPVLDRRDFAFVASCPGVWGVPFGE